MRRLPRAPGGTPGIHLFAVLVFLLMAVPKLNVKIGPVPLYAIDVVIAFLIWKAIDLPGMGRNRRKFTTTIGTILVFAMVSEYLGALTFGTVQESIYIAVRTCLAFSLFFLTGQFVRSPYDIEMVLRAVVLGLLVTATLMILSSLPMTRPAVFENVFAHSFLDPAGETNDSIRDSETGTRGRTLIGVSILGATFINVCWPLAAILLRWPWRVSVLWRGLALSACLLAPMGVLMSYSRGPILGSVLIILAALFFGYRYVRRGILVPVLVGITVVLSVGVTSNLFFFDRLTNRTQAVFSNPLTDERESERLLSYVEPIEHVSENPRFLVVGEGVTTRYANGRVAPEQAGKATHAVFAMAYYSYGFLAAILYLVLIARALLASGAASLRGRSVSSVMAQSMFLSMVALLPWVVFGHAAVSSPRGAMLFFFVLGLISSLAHFRLPLRTRDSQRRWGDVQGRHLAVR